MAALLLDGCSARVTVSEVVGTYVANRGHGVDVLEIKGDGTYFYTCKFGEAPDFENTIHSSNAPQDRSDFINHDHWSLHYDNGDLRITLDHFQACALDYRRPAGFWDVPVKRSWTGGIRLPIDSDVNYYFVKKNHS
jgi:hypothetical protein